MKVNLYKKTGKIAEDKFEFSDSLLSEKVNKPLLSQIVYVYLSNQRQANAQVKNRSEVSGGGRKPWNQKGTGRARHGSSRSPIWKGGGITFGPSNERNYKKSVTKKMTVAGIKSALKFMIEEKRLSIIDDLVVEKSKEVLDIVNNINLKGKVTFVQLKEEGLYRCSRNLDGINSVLSTELNVYEILNSGNLIITKSAAENMEKVWGKKVEVKEVKKEKDTKKEVVKSSKKTKK